MEKTIAIPQGLYERLAHHAHGFDTPADVISRLLDFVERNEAEFESKPFESASSLGNRASASPIMSYPGKIEIKLYPDDPRQFKKQLLEKREAWVLLRNADGSRDLKHWNAQRFSESSDVLGNLRSGYLRGWRERGIVRADVAIDRRDLDNLA